MKLIKRFFQVLVIIILASFLVFVFPTSPSNELVSLVNSKIENLIKPSNPYFILIDYDQPIYKKRLWVIDFKTQEVIINVHVSHAKKSGSVYANDFSNIINSKKSCIGLFQTLHSYESNYGKGEYKIGMRLKGLESNNNNVLSRNIVFHPSYGLWSEGCFMTFPKINKKIIELTQGGSLLYVHKS